MHHCVGVLLVQRIAKGDEESEEFTNAGQTVWDQLSGIFCKDNLFGTFKLQIE